MTDRSRRGFLKSASIGGAVAGAAVLLPRPFAQAAVPAQAVPGAEAPTTGPAGPAVTGPLVAYVKDATSGQIAVMHGEREIVHQDRALAASLARIAARA